MSLPRALLSLVLLGAWHAPAAAAHHPLRVVPSVFDPGDTDAVSSAWAPFDHVGRALVLSKQATTATDAAALATVENVAGERLDELGFDYWDRGHWRAGAAPLDDTPERRRR